MEDNFKLYDEKYLNTGLFVSIVSIIILLLTLMGCTMSFQTISTHGTASDLVDENQTPTNTVSPNVNVPVKPI